MSRALKLRAWSCVKSKMYYFNAFEKFGFIQHQLEPETHASFGSKQILLTTNPEVYAWMQWTGLRDINGKRIWEGDIVKDCSDSDLVFPVEWDNEYCGYAMPKEYNEEYLFPLNSVELEVIGNIYETPELLKDGRID